MGKADEETNHSRHKVAHERNTGAVSADILHFPARVLVSQAARSWNAQQLCSQAGFCRSSSCHVRFPVRRAAPPELQARGGSVRQSVNTPWARGRVRLKGISRTTPIGWLQHVSVARRPRLIAGLQAPHPRCQSAFRQASVPGTPNAEARDCVGRRRTQRVDAPC